jgi:hypothetical protein
VVLAAIAVAKIRGEATTEGIARPLPGGAKWRSANQIPSKPHVSAFAAVAKASSNASSWV